MTYALRLPDHVMEQAKAVAEAQGTSLNQLFTSFIAYGLGQHQAFETIRRRAARADVPAVLELLAQAPDLPAAEGDEMP
ncbi:hypothetical protein [Methylobacterium sp. J-076]|uniref:hypothetical protein n=1 Tax=Methylobacterium sp. J-076 TaxID=2836655 RepID=UPI001FBA873F|nr:hypothetical protein [Methylobacterium sp. J-076]MCJ2012007.1 hypothetical protein [Methylobacterium sp. J-076]